MQGLHGRIDKPCGAIRCAIIEGTHLYKPKYEVKIRQVAADLQWEAYMHHAATAATDRVSHEIATLPGVSVRAPRQ